MPLPTDHDPDTERLVTRLRFRHLRLITELRRGGSLRAAAEALSLTQPALSKALRELEGAFGFPLFTRTARGVTPTAQGEVALRGAGLLLAELAHLRVEVAAGNSVAAVVRVGAPPFVAQGYLPAVLARLAHMDPPVRVQLLEERVPLLLEALAGGQLDALVTSYPAQMPALGVALQFEKLFDAEFFVIAPPHHPLTRARRVGWERLAAESWVMPAPTSMLRRLIEQGFLQAGLVPPVPVVESTSPVTNVQLVAAGLGLSAAPAATVRHELAIGRVKRVRVTPAIAPGPVALIWRAGVANPRVALLREALLTL
jgi:LysR family transcriptional regulator of abg operon